MGQGDAAGVGRRLWAEGAAAGGAHRRRRDPPARRPARDPVAAALGARGSGGGGPQLRGREGDGGRARLRLVGRTARARAGALVPGAGLQPRGRPGQPLPRRRAAGRADGLHRHQGPLRLRRPRARRRRARRLRQRRGGGQVLRGRHPGGLRAAAARAGGGRRAPVQHLLDGRRPRGRDPQLRQGADPDARAGPRRAAMTTIRGAIIQANANLREDGPTVTRMRELARDHGMALIVPFYEEAQPGVYYNSAVVIERDGSVLGKYRKTHIPQVGPCFWEKYYFKPGNLGYPVFETSVGRVGLIICYDRHFPEVARQLGLKGAQLVFNPSATVESLSRYLWELEQPAHAVANGYWIAAINRVGTEEPLNSNRFYGSSYFCDPRGQIVARASEDSDEVLVADIDLNKAREVGHTWQFLRDRRPETYGELTELLP